MPSAENEVKRVLSAFNLINLVLEEATPVLKWYLGAALLSMDKKKKGIPIGTPSQISKGDHWFELQLEVLKEKTLNTDNVEEYINWNADTAVEELEVEVKRGNIIYVGELPAKHCSKSKVCGEKKTRDGIETMQEASTNTSRWFKCFKCFTKRDSVAEAASLELSKRFEHIFVRDEDPEPLLSREQTMKAKRSFSSKFKTLSHFRSVPNVFRLHEKGTDFGNGRSTRLKNVRLALEIDLNCRLRYGPQVRTFLKSMKPWMKNCNMDTRALTASFHLQFCVSEDKMSIKNLSKPEFEWDIELSYGAFDLPDWFEDGLLREALEFAFEKLPEVVLKRRPNFGNLAMVLPMTEEEDAPCPANLSIVLSAETTEIRVQQPQDKNCAPPQ